MDENGNPPLNFLFQMKSLVDVANITSALPPRCVASQPVRTHLYTNVIGHLLIDLLLYLLTYSLHLLLLLLLHLVVVDVVVQLRLITGGKQVAVHLS